MREADPSVTEVPRGWVEGLQAALEAAGWPGGPEAAKAAASAYAARLPGSYFERTAPVAAAADLLECQVLEASGDADRVCMAVQPDPDPGAGMFRFRLYGHRAVELSSFLPVLESFGLTVVEAVPHHVVGLPDAPGAGVHLDDFGLRVRSRCPFEPVADGARLVAAVQAVWQGQAEADSLNRLVVSAGIDWRDVVVLRAYRRYRRQVGTAWSDRQLDDPLADFPSVAVALLDYFAARFDPAAPAGAGAGDPAAAPGSTPAGDPATARPAAARRAVLESLTAVERLDQDLVLRAYLGLIDATLRTSYYGRTADGDFLPTLTIKLDSARVPELPPPRPQVEAFVYSPRVEGIHLRGGLIARGGIRWSDRQDDLRTEVLGLVRSQVLKNAGIVPTGAKGGFVCRRLDRAADRPDVDVVSEVRECYRLFINGLLDITDNVVAGRVISPPGVRPADGADTYLVVAADRGTAELSDLANEISARRGFWLGDAFASGGHHGYDHKAMGITARGAWVAARQHFRQLGIDPEQEEIRVVGIGDMSGDVFGNGMLQSRTIKLVAAFDHRDVFVDPTPDPERSFAERTRLFGMPGSRWQDYDRAALSAGGGVWSRTTKRIELAPQAVQALGLASATVSPLELVSAILTASADLLWLGGIGTFVKAPTESHADAGDHTNDAIRVNADQVRARVVAEGGNLGFTQRARIAYSRRGGKINTDFIDNAAGVATSDYEVNLKILLDLAIERGQLPVAERDTMLSAFEDDVAAAVLHDVGRSAIAVTRAVPASATDLDAFEALMAGLELAGRLDRKVEALPDGEEIAVRRAAGAGLTRPEAAVLLALAKSDLAHVLVDADLVTAPDVQTAVEDYFPDAVTDRFGDLIGEHRLYPELVGTRVAGEIVDRMGITWAHETADELGADLPDVAGAYWAARQVLGANQRWRQVETLAATVPPDAEELLHHHVVAAVDRLARRYLSDPRPRYDDAVMAAAIEAGWSAVPACGTARGAEAGDIRRLVDFGLDRDQAEAFALLQLMAAAADVGALTRALGATVADVVAALDAFDRGVGVPALGATLTRIPVASRWERWQVRRLLDDVASLRRAAVMAIHLDNAARATPGAGAGPQGPSAAIEAWLAGRYRRLARFRRLTAQLGDSVAGGQLVADAQSVAALAVRALADLVGSEPEDR